MQRTVAPFFAAFLAALGTSGCSYLFPSCATIPDCPKGQKLCNNLNCSDVSTDPLNCGFCDNACSEGLACIPDAGPDGGPACGCAVAGQTKVGAHCYDFSVDSRNCGGFGKSCRPDQVCFDGGCGCPMPDYLASFLDGGDGECAGDAGPVCADLINDPANCGVCGRVCAGECTLGECEDGGVQDAGEIPDAGDGGDAGTLGDAGDGR